MNYFLKHVTQSHQRVMFNLMRKILSFKFLMSSLIFFLATSSLTTCKKTDLLPAVTSEGKDTFGCLVNGRPFIPRPNPRDLIQPGTPVQGFFSNIICGVSGLDYSSKGLGLPSVSVTVVQPVSPGVFQVNSKSRNTLIYIGPLTNFVPTDSLGTGTITIVRYDTVNHICSGTFEGTLNGNGAQIRLTNGRFDVRVSKI